MIKQKQKKSIKIGNKIKNKIFKGKTMSIRLIFRKVNKSDNKKMDNEYLKKFAKHLKQIRKEKNIKQDDFLDVNGISRSTIAMVETGKTDITLSKLKIIADVLGVNLKELLDFD